MIDPISPHTARRHTRQMLQRSVYAYHVAEALYRAVEMDGDANLSALDQQQQMPYRTAAERAITDLLNEDHRS